MLFALRESGRLRDYQFPNVIRALAANGSE